MIRTLIALALWLCIGSAQLFAALSASTVWEVRQSGSDTNGGGYVSGGTDWSQQDAAQYSVTDGVTAGTTTITSASAAFGTDVVGNIMYVAGGTGSVTAGWYQITARTNSTTITVDRSTGLTAGTGVTLKIGGALASIGQAGAVQVGGNTIWCKGSLTVTSSSSNVSGGRATISPSFSSTANTRVLGYGTTRGDQVKATITVSGAISSFAIFTVSDKGTEFADLILDGASKTSITGISGTCQPTRCHFVNLTTGTSGVAPISECFFKNCGTGISGASLAAVSNCAFASCTTGADDIRQPLTGCFFIACTTGLAVQSFTEPFAYFNNSFYGNGTALSINATGRTGKTIRNNVITGSTTRGVNVSAGGAVFFANNAYYSNTAANVLGTGSVETGAVTLTGDPFLNSAATLNSLADVRAAFALNNTAGAGSACRGTGTPSYLDIGAAQHQDSGGGSSAHSFTFAQ